MEDEVKQQIEQEVGGRIKPVPYFDMVKELSESFGVPLDLMGELHEYWFTQDPSVLSENGRDYLLMCASCFAVLVERNDG